MDGSLAARPLRALVAIVAAVACLALATPALGSALIARDIRGHVTLKVNRSGVALLTYREAGGRLRHVLAWGAANGAKQFKLDRSGGWASGVAHWQTLRNACRSYRGPALWYRVAACTAPDGSHWAVQEWRRVVKVGTHTSGQRELRLSHWRGPLAQLWARGDWSWYGRYRHLYGRLTYRGKPVVARCYRPNGYVCDLIGRNVMLDALDSDYGKGWRHVNGFLASVPSGQFCYGLNRKRQPDGSLSRTGVSRRNRYRVSVAGPYVTPDLVVAFALIPGRYDEKLDARANAAQRRLVKSNTRNNCLPIN